MRSADCVGIGLGIFGGCKPNNSHTDAEGKISGRGQFYITLLTYSERSRLIGVVEDRTAKAAELLWRTLIPPHGSFLRNCLWLVVPLVRPTGDFNPAGSESCPTSKQKPRNHRLRG